MASEKKSHRSNSPQDPDGSASDANEDETTKDGQSNMVDFFRIFHYADGLSKVLYALAFLGAIAVGASLPLMTLVFGSSTASFNGFSSGRGDPQQFTSRVNSLVLYFVYLFIARFVIGYLATLCICIAAARTTNSLRKAFLEHVLRQEVSHFDLQTNGSTASQVTTNGNRINQGIAEKLYTAIMAMSLFFSSYIVALAVQWKLALITMSIVPAMVIILSGTVALDVPIESRITRLYSRAGVLAQDALGSIKTIHAFGAHRKISRWYSEYMQQAFKEGKKKSVLYGVMFSTQNFLVMSGTALAFWEGFRMFRSGEIANVGKVVTVILSVTLGATSVISLLPQISAFTNASSAAAELFSIIDKPSQLDPLSQEGAKPDKFEGHVQIEDLHFSYPSRPQAVVLGGLNLSLPAGKTTALVGASGCGKSSVVALLERWYQPTSGRILLDGLDIANFNTEWLRSNIRLIQQEPTLFQGTILQNVAHGLVGAQRQLSSQQQMQLVKDACISADAHDFIERLPQGYNTQLGERANTLSGGQRQRLSIARSIISDPRVLLFDEATSALDPQAERTVQEALNRVSENKTTLIIAHKLATVMRAANIVVMANGRVVEQGTHQELIEQDGLYAAMVRGQNLGSHGEGHDMNEKATSSRIDYTDDLLPTKTGSRDVATLHATVTNEARSELTSGTVNYSLIKCVRIMLSEQKTMYPWFAVMVVVYVVLGGTYPAQAILFSRLIRAFILQGDEAQSQANFYALMYFVVALANLVGYFCVGVAFNEIGRTITLRYRQEMLDRILEFDQDFFDCPGNDSGSLASKLSSVPSSIQELMSGNLGLIINVVVNVLASGIMAIAFGWKLGLTLVFAGLAIITGSGYVRIRLDQKLEAATEKQFTKSASLAAEAVSSIRTVSLLTMERAVLQQYNKTLDEIVAKVIKNLVVTLVPYALSQSIDFLVMALGFWYGSRLIASGEYSTTQFFVIFISVVFGGQAAAQFFTWTTSITKAKGSANYLLWLRTIKPKIRESSDDSGSDKPPRTGPPSIGIEDVSFSYPQRSGVKVLRDVSLDIKDGAYVAFVGASGCGKSTVMNLLERFYDPTTGRITTDGADISQLSPAAHRAGIALVQQEPPLYQGSVRDNVALGLSETPTDARVHEACRAANALDFVSSLPQGLDTPCGTRGMQFSGGQRQRIALARALIRDPRLLLLDEATSALDSNSERIVQEALDAAAAAGRTTVAVAHRLSTVRAADVIFVLDRGRVAEVGTHEQLRKLGGRYHAMCLAQSLDQP